MRLQTVVPRSQNTELTQSRGASVELTLIPPSHKVRLYDHSSALEEMTQIGEHATNAAFRAVNGE